MTTKTKYSKLDLGTIEAVFNKLGGVDGAQRFLRGDVEVVVRKHIIDCDADPFCPDDWKVVEHKKGGQLEWNSDNVQLFLAEGQKEGRYIEGNQLRKELEGQSVLNANVLDYLLDHQELIPESWKGRYVFFWDTIYRRRSGGDLCVRALCFRGRRWDWRYDWLDRVFGDDDPAACLASVKELCS